MEPKTKVQAETGKQEIRVTREFELPLELLFKAYEEAELLEQWMGTKVLKLDNKNHGSYRFETTDPRGRKHYFSGTIHAFQRNVHIIRTFEMEGTAFPVQLEFLDFEELSADRSQLTMHIIFRSPADRDQLLQLPFVQGINWAHNRLQTVASLNQKQ